MTRNRARLSVLYAVIKKNQLLGAFNHDHASRLLHYPGDSRGGRIGLVAAEGKALNVKHFYDTKQGIYQRERTQSEIKAQRDHEMRLREEAKATLERLAREGRRVVIHYSDSYDAANRGLSVLPVPRLTPEGYLAWGVR